MNKMVGISKSAFKRMEAFAKQLRIQNKIRENRDKPILHSDDVLESVDFTFSKFRPDSGAGDSGDLFIAKQKGNTSVCYLVKHAFTDCACNEYMYYKVADRLGLHVPPVKLMNIAETEKRKYFRTEIAAAIEWLDITQIVGGKYEIMDNLQVANKEDFFAFQALYNILGEEDSFELVVAGNTLYKIDNTAAFNLEDSVLINLGFDYEYTGIADTKGVLFRQLMTCAEFSEYYKHKATYDLLVKKYGEDIAAPYLRIYEQFSELDVSMFDECLNTLCYFYADMVGDFYKRFLQLRKDECIRFLEEMGR